MNVVHVCSCRRSAFERLECTRRADVGESAAGTVHVEELRNHHLALGSAPRGVHAFHGGCALRAITRAAPVPLAPGVVHIRHQSTSSTQTYSSFLMGPPGSTWASPLPSRPVQSTPSCPVQSLPFPGSSVHLVSPVLSSPFPSLPLPSSPVQSTPTPLPASPFPMHPPEPDIFPGRVDLG